MIIRRDSTFRRLVRCLNHGVAIAVMLTLAACASGPGIPDTTYFRLPPRADMQTLAAPVIIRPIVVNTFYADGLYSDQAIIYTLDPEGSRLRTYHYQLWIDPPVRLLQRRLISTLRAAGVSRVATDRLPTEVETLQVEGRIVRLERVRTDAGWRVAVGLSLRADIDGDGEPPLVLKDYVLELPVQGESVNDSIAVMGQAIDQIYAEFVRDLVAGAQRQG